MWRLWLVRVLTHQLCGGVFFVPGEQAFQFVEPALLVRHHVGLLHLGQLAEESFVFWDEFLGDDELDFNVQIPVRPPRGSGIPFPRRRMTSPGCVPGDSSTSVFPSRRGISIFEPRPPACS